MNKKILYWIVGCLLSALFLYLSLRGTNFHEITETFVKTDLWYLFPVFGSLLLFYWIKAIRWRILLIPIGETKTRELFPSMMTGIAVNLLLFGYVGEFVRTYILGKQRKLKKSSVLATIFLERIFDLFTILILAGIGLASTGYLESDLMNMKMLGALFLIGIMTLSIMAISVIWTTPFLNLLVKMTVWIPKKAQEKLLHQLEHAIHGFRSLSKIRLVIGILLTSFAMWGFMAMAHYLSIIAVGAHVPFSAALLIIVLITIGISLPSAPGHIGLFQLVYVLVLKPFGVDAEHAFTGAVIYHIALSSTIILLGMLSMRSLGMNLQDTYNYEPEIDQ